jgi:hypothetical protein
MGGTDAIGGTMAAEEGAPDTKREGSFHFMTAETMAVEEGGAEVQQPKGESAPSNKKGSLRLKLDDNEENDAYSYDGCCLRMLNGRWCSCCGGCIARWPRTFAIFFAVVLPLWLLIAISSILGYFLAKLEAPNEIIQNDDILEAQAELREIGSLAARAAQAIPKICFELFLLARPVTDMARELEIALEKDDNFFPAETAQPVTDILSDDLIVLNKTAMYEFMQLCGDEARPITERLLQRGGDIIDISAAELTFNWIRCGPWANGLDSSGVLDPHDVVDLRPEAQEEFYRETWNDDQQRLFDEYRKEYTTASNSTAHLEESVGTNLTVIAARFLAFQNSIGNATGGTKCYLNGPGSGKLCLVAVSLSSLSFFHISLTLVHPYYLTTPAWFWFTIMTTVGYGNQAPETTGGRAMVYSLGFLSILAFAGILASSGSIVSVIFDDAVNRIKVQSLTTPWVAVCVWGAIYYLWMALIALCTRQWKEYSLGIGK